MFKFFTWTKFAGWCAVAASFVTGTTGLAIGGIIHIPQALLGAIGAILAGVSTVVTTTKAGTATDSTGTQVNGTPGGK